MSIEEILEHLTVLEMEAEHKAANGDHDNYRYINKGLALGIRATTEYLAFIAKHEDVIVCGLAEEVWQDLRLKNV